VAHLSSLVEDVTTLYLAIKNYRVANKDASLNETWITFEIKLRGGRARVFFGFRAPEGSLFSASALALAISSLLRPKERVAASARSGSRLLRSGAAPPSHQESAMTKPLALAGRKDPLESPRKPKHGPPAPQVRRSEAGRIATRTLTRLGEQKARKYLVILRSLDRTIR
jgi:hypothetical protein